MDAVIRNNVADVTNAITKNWKGKKMTIKNLLSLLATLLFSQTLIAEVDNDALLNLMREKDRISQAIGYEISFVMTTNDNQFKDPNQGMVYMDCETTWLKEDTFAMKIQYYYEHLPVYGRIRTHNYAGYDYRDGNLIVWRTLEAYILFSPDRNDTLEKVRVFYVDPNNKIVDMGDNIKLHRFKIGDTNNKYRFNQFEMATGRGFSKHLTSNISITSQPPRLTEITSQDSWLGVGGRWKLTIDPVSDNLVRGAIFTMNAATRPSVEVTTGGVIEKDGIKMAKYGTVKYSSDLELDIEVTDISKIIGKNDLYEGVAARLNEPLPKGAGIIDLTGTKPVRSTVK